MHLTSLLLITTTLVVLRTAFASPLPASQPKPTTAISALDASVSALDASVSALNASVSALDPSVAIDPILYPDPIDSIDDIVPIAESIDLIEKIDISDPIEAMEAFEATHPLPAVDPVKAIETIEAIDPPVASDHINHIAPAVAAAIGLIDHNDPDPVKHINPFDAIVDFSQPRKPHPLFDEDCRDVFGLRKTC